MARAYHKTTQGQLEYWCPNCEEWEDPGCFTRRELYTVDGHWYLNGQDYYDDYTMWDVWTHDSCEEMAAEPDYDPLERRQQSVWVCGDCKSEFDDQEDAAECCL